LVGIFGHVDRPQVLRYSALLFGVFYGFSHQRSIYANDKAAHAEHEYKHKEALIQKAKAEFAKKNLPPQSKTADGGGKFPKQFGGHGSCLRNCPSSKTPSADMRFHSYHQSRRQEL
jgi:hypothetical protein